MITPPSVLVDGTRRVPTTPEFDSWRNQIATAEQRDGWLSACEDAGQFLLLSRQFVGSLGDLLRWLEAGPVLEVCAGRGELAEALNAAGVHVVATDADAPPGSSVVSMSAQQALRRYRPAAVLGAFVPVDSGVDEAVIGCPTVRHYIVLGARIGGFFGSAALWRNSSWTGQPLDQVSRWMLTRHDVWIETPKPTILQHGEAWHFRRLAVTSGQRAGASGQFRLPTSDLRLPTSEP